MQQLSGHDASFLYLETPNAPMTGGGIYIYDPATAPGGRVTFKGILEHLEQRLHLARAFRQKLVHVPLDLDHPYWIEDRNFDLEYHVRHIALPQPGDWRQLYIQAARLLARPLDMSRPLWELYVIEGLNNVEGVPPGSFAIVLKLHHAGIDGMSGMELLSAIHDPTADAGPPAPATEWKPEDPPSAWWMLAQANVNNLTRPMHLLRLVRRTGPRLVRRPRAMRPPRGDAVGLSGAPRTRFNRTVSAHRVLESARFPLDEMRRIKSAVPGATVNDVVIATVGGAMRDYLNDKGELPTKPLVVMCPISVRTEEEKGTGGNKVSGMFTSLATDVADAGERLRVVSEASRASKELTEAVDARTLSEYSQFVPGALAGLANRLSSRLGLTNRGNLLYNTVISNVPGPQEPIYFCGARLDIMVGFGMVHDGIGLFHGVSSYCGQVVIGMMADRAMMPDPEFYAACMNRSFRALAAATT